VGGIKTKKTKMLEFILAHEKAERTTKTRKSHKKNRWHKTATYLPIEVFEILQSLFPDDSEHEFSRAVKLMNRIIDKYINEDKEYFESVCIPYNYYRTILTGDGEHIWKVLMENEVIIRTKNWSTINHKAAEYIFNPKIDLGNPVRVEYLEVPKRMTPLDKEVKCQLDRISLNLSMSLDDFIESRTQRIEDSVRRKINGKTYTNSKRQVKKIEGDVEEFIVKKIESNKLKQFKQLQAIIDRKWRAERNDTNFRLDTNLTNLHGDFIELIEIDGHKPQKVDLRNSQFVIFSNLLQSVVNGEIDQKFRELDLVDMFYNIVYENYKGCKMSPMSKQKDLFEFCELCRTGNIYEELARILDLKLEDGELDRRSGKQMAFKLFFDQPRHSKSFKSIQERFPTVVKIINSFKEYMIAEEFKTYFKNTDDYQKTHSMEYDSKKMRSWIDFVRRKGSSSFSIMLQQIESRLFIDLIYIPLMDEHILYSIHDSFIFVNSDLKEVIESKLKEYLPYGFELAG